MENNQHNDQNRSNYILWAEKLWLKSRINAFAHKVALRSNKYRGSSLSAISILSGVGSIIAVLLTYVVSQQTFVHPLHPSDTPIDVAASGTDAIYVFIMTFFQKIIPDGALYNNIPLTKGYIALCLALTSVFLSTLSLILSIFTRSGRYDAKANEHGFLQSMYLDIAQRCGPLKADRIDISDKEFEIRLTHLEEQFKTIKMRGSEPSDRQFHKAHKILSKRKDTLSKKYISILDNHNVANEQENDANK